MKYHTFSMNVNSSTFSVCVSSSEESLSTKRMKGLLMILLVKENIRQLDKHHSGVNDKGTDRSFFFAYTGEIFPFIQVCPFSLSFRNYVVELSCVANFLFVHVFAISTLSLSPTNTLCFPTLATFLPN